MVKTRIRVGENQWYPENPLGEIAGDGETIIIREDRNVPDYPHELIWEGWSPGTNYSHTILLRITVLPRMIIHWWDRIAELLGGW